MKESSDKSKPQSLEELFRARMEAAEVQPSDRVWERIEQGLDLKEAGYYKERVNWYRSLAAACIALVVCAAMYSYYDVNTQHRNSGTELASRPQTQINPTIADSKPTRTPANAAAQNENINNQPAATEPSTKPDNALSAQQGLANVKPAGKNNSAVIGSNPPNNQTDKAGNLERTYATAETGTEKLSRGDEALTAGLSNRKDNNLAEAGKITFDKNEAEVRLPGAKVAASDLELLEPVKTWAGLSKLSAATDTLWKPRTIEAAPPALALVPTSAPEPRKPHLSRWSFSAKYAPQYFNQNIELASAASPQYLAAPANGNFSGAPAAAVNTWGYTDALNEFDKNTTSGFSYSSAVAAGYALNESLTLETGLLFTQNVANSQSSYVFDNTYLAARYSNASRAINFNDTKDIGQAAVLPATALVASLSGQQNLQNSAIIQTPTFEVQYRYRSVGVPVKLNYQTKNRKSFYFASVGLLTNLLVQAQVISESSRVPDIKYGSNPESPFRPWQFATILSAGKGFRVSKALSLRAGLEGTQYLTSLAANPENLNGKQRKPYTIGVAFSSSYTLGR